MIRQGSALGYTVVSGGTAVNAVLKDDLLWRVTDHGAVNDGVTDTTTGLQAAINTSPAGATVFFPRGTYLISAPIRLLPYRRYVGDGWAKSNGALIRQKDGANITGPGEVTGLLVPDAWYTNAAQCDGQLAIDNLAVDGNKTENPDSTACGVIVMNFWSQVTRCYIAATPVDCIRLTDVTNNGVNVISNSASECDLLDNKLDSPDGAGIRQISANNNSLMDGNCKDNRISYVGTDAISFERAAGWTFDNNHTYGVPGTAIGLGGCYATRVVNNYVEDFGGEQGDGAYYAGVAVSLLDGRGTVVAGNQVSGSELGATSVYHYIRVNANTGQTDTHAVVSNNIIDGPGAGDGIAVVVQHSSGGVAQVERANNRISNIATPYYTAGGDIIHQGSEATLPAVRIYKAGSTTLADNALTPIPLGVVHYNRDPAFFDTSVADTVTVLVFGMYLVAVDMNFEGGDAGYRAVQLNLNGATVREVSHIGTDVRSSISAPLELSPGDELTVSTYTSGGDPPAINGGTSNDVGLAVVRLGF